MPAPNARGSTGPPPDQPRVSENGAPSGAVFVSGDGELTAPLVPEQIPRQAADSQGRIADFLTNLGVPPDRVDPDVVRSAAEAMAVEPLAPADAIEAAALADAIGRGSVTPGEADRILGAGAADAIRATASRNRKIPVKAGASKWSLPPRQKLSARRFAGFPEKLGNGPIGDDGETVEGHHRDQVHGGLWVEMTRTDHRLGENFKDNHHNTGQKATKIDSRRSKWERRTFFSRDYKEGRFDDLPKLSQTEREKLRAAAKARRQARERQSKQR